MSVKSKRPRASKGSARREDGALSFASDQHSSLKKEQLVMDKASQQEASLCVFCRKPIKQGRLLPCLHNACLRCVQSEVTGTNALHCQRCGTLAKPPPSGHSQLQALPACYNTHAFDSGAEAQAGKLMCDECMEEEAAETVCLSCGLHLCANHTHNHKRSRSTHGHEIQSTLADAYSASTAVVENSACSLHAAEQLELYCQTCSDLFCKRCDLLGSHGDHPESVVAVKEAARKRRQELIEMREAASEGLEVKPAIEGGDGDGGSADASAGVKQTRLPEAAQLKAGLQATEASISRLNKRIEMVSAQVEAAFGQVVDTAKQRQQTLLDELDAIRWKASQRLEEQHQRLASSIAAGQQIDVLLDRCQNDVDFLRMSTWLKESMHRIDECLQKDLQPVVSSHAVFRQENLAGVVVLASKVGRIIEEAIDETQSRLSCPGSAAVETDMKIEVEAKNPAGVSVPLEVVKEMETFSLCIIPESGEAVQCELGLGSSASMLEAHFKPLASGKYTVSATMDHRHLRGSPKVLDARAERRVPFDPERIGPNIQLSNNNCSAQYTYNGEYSAVCSLQTISSGQTDFRVRLDSFTSGYDKISLVVTKQSPPVLNTSGIGEAYGWYLHSQGSGYGGGVSPASFQQGDEITVLLDCDRSQVSFTMERIKMTQVLYNLPAGEYYLCVCFYTSDTSYYPSRQSPYGRRQQPSYGSPKVSLM